MKANNIYKISDFDDAYRVNRKFDDFYIVQKNGKFGVYNKLNNTLSTDIVYDKIESVDIAGNIFKAWQNNKCILINVECIHCGNKGFVTKKSKNEYDSIETILNAIGFRVKAKNNGKYGILDTVDCKMESDFLYDDIEYDKYENLYLTYIDGKKGIWRVIEPGEYEDYRVERKTSKKFNKILITYTKIIQGKKNEQWYDIKKYKELTIDKFRLFGHKSPY